MEFRSPLNFIFVDGKIYFHCAKEGHKLDAILRRLGAKYFPEGYDIESDMRRNGPRAAVVEIDIDHLSGKHVREK